MALLLALQSCSRAVLDAKATSGELVDGEPWLLTGEKTLAVAVANDDYIVLPDKVLWLGADIDCEYPQQYPAARAGEVHRVSFPGKIGGTNGVEVTKNALLICRQDTSQGTHEDVGQYWTVINDTTQIPQHTHDSAETGGQLQHNALSGRDEADAHPQYVQKSLFNANTILAADSDDTPATLTMGESTILARLMGEGIKAASVEEILNLLSVASGATVGVANVAAGSFIKSGVSQTISDVGFSPRLVIFAACIDNTTAASIGFYANNSSNRSIGHGFNGGVWYPRNIYSVQLHTSSGNAHYGKVVAVVSDGFTMQWEDYGSPTGAPDITWIAVK